MLPRSTMSILTSRKRFAGSIGNAARADNMDNM